MTKSIVAIPARDEADRIGACLTALNSQRLRPDAVVLLLNNCTDATETIARAMAPCLDFQLRIFTLDLPNGRANAGHARRLAMRHAAQCAGNDGILLTTDADSVAPPEWLARNLAALRNGADVVCGRAIIDPLEAKLIPAHLHEDDARECRLVAALDHLAFLLDPEPHDPLPRHTEASGASLAVTLQAFNNAGGIPDISSGEDRAFVRALWMMDARVRHDPTIQVTVSGRIAGRAPGGMADAIRRRMVRQDAFTDDQVEPARHAFRRYALRCRARHAWAGTADSTLAGDLGLPWARLSTCLSHPTFGAAWAALETSSPALQRRGVRFIDLPAEIAIAEALLRQAAIPETLAAD